MLSSKYAVLRVLLFTLFFSKQNLDGVNCLLNFNKSIGPRGFKFIILTEWLLITGGLPF